MTAEDFQIWQAVLTYYRAQRKQEGLKAGCRTDVAMLPMPRNLKTMQATYYPSN
jgi:hypothetical protein